MSFQESQVDTLFVEHPQADAYALAQCFGQEQLGEELFSVLMDYSQTGNPELLEQLKVEMASKRMQHMLSEETELIDTHMEPLVINKEVVCAFLDKHGTQYEQGNERQKLLYYIMLSYREENLQGAGLQLIESNITKQILGDGNGMPLESDIYVDYLTITDELGHTNSVRTNEDALEDVIDEFEADEKHVRDLEQVIHQIERNVPRQISTYRVTLYDYSATLAEARKGAVKFCTLLLSDVEDNQAGFLDYMDMLEDYQEMGDISGVRFIAEFDNFGTMRFTAMPIYPEEPESVHVPIMWSRTLSAHMIPYFLKKEGHADLFELLGMIDERLLAPNESLLKSKVDEEKLEQLETEAEDIVDFLRYGQNKLVNEFWVDLHERTFAPEEIEALIALCNDMPGVSPEEHERMDEFFTDLKNDKIAYFKAKIQLDETKRLFLTVESYDSKDASIQEEATFRLSHLGIITQILQDKKLASLYDLLNLNKGEVKNSLDMSDLLGDEEEEETK